MNIGNYNVSIYGDGKWEYEGYYLMVIEDDTTVIKRSAYIRGDRSLIEQLSEDEISTIFEGHESARYIIANKIYLHEE